jgi:hypothetical protein
LTILAGPAITAELTYLDRISGRLSLNFGFSFNLYYRPSDIDIYAGVNLIPAVYFFLFHHAARKAENSEDFELDLFKPNFPPPPKKRG